MKTNNKNKGFVIQGVIAVIALLIIAWGAFYFSSKNSLADISITVTSPSGRSYSVGSTTSISYKISGDIKPEYHVALIAEPGYVPITVIPAMENSTYVWTIPETMCLGGDACMPTQSGEYTITAQVYSEETCIGFCMRNENAKLLSEGKSGAFTITNGTTTNAAFSPVDTNAPQITSVINVVESGDIMVVSGQRLYGGNGFGIYIDNKIVNGDITTNSSANSLSFHLPSLTNGVHTLYVMNDVSGKSNTVNFTVNPDVHNAIKVLSPNGGEVLKKGQSYNIIWKISNPNNLTRLILMPGEIAITPFTNAATNFTSPFSWIIPSTLQPGKYRIEVREYTDLGNVPTLVGSDMSDDEFTITN